ncbi:MAG: homoserine dehydrogenase [Clostridiales bacterium]|uniref:homoserine dehydrogenase n=1 Tax=Terrisporobacter sp. TaxID=1965305 RepID=UPI002A524CC3|nr:homoserine dehydrogenase [Terrisporobacter sp.]MCI5629592.1 homoserine dehydrogenase [Clostridium sp.]MDD7756217.1 homoserine dehydrogenase [Clostridiales bacterium]MDY4135756.1 homoserine dehydrogenase [Terrisporobacter sp.]MDY4737644.1 homoserine dehydrogenase [Terrisporobacter sp.]
MRIAILGYGTVGKGLVEMIEGNKERRNIEITNILVRNKDKYKSSKYSDKITENIEDVFNTDIDILVELMGGLHPSYEYIKRALENKINVVTANKDMLAEYGDKLVKISKDNKVSLRFEASVGGGIPVLKPLTESLEGNDIESVYAILNGTTNFILSKMYDEGLPYEEVLKEAQDLGFAEANPEADVEGYDAARKLSILSTLAYHRRVYWKDFYLEGISNIDMKDIDYAKKMGCKIKLVGQSRKNDKTVSGFVRPVLVDNNSLLSKIDNEYNIVVLNGNSVGELSFVGKGAGKEPTGSAVYSDLIDILDKRISNIDSFMKDKIEVEKTISSNCQVLLRFKSPKKEEIIELIKACVDKYEIIEDNDELAIMVYADSEYEINNILCLIKDKGYCKESRKILKIS